jgi:hypothetical protein
MGWFALSRTPTSVFSGVGQLAGFPSGVALQLKPRMAAPIWPPSARKLSIYRPNNYGACPYQRSTVLASVARTRAFPPARCVFETISAILNERDAIHSRLRDCVKRMSKVGRQLGLGWLALAKDERLLRRQRTRGCHGQTNHRRAHRVGCSISDSSAAQREIIRGNGKTGILNNPLDVAADLRSAAMATQSGHCATRAALSRRVDRKSCARSPYE